jgi:hypothetical protein
MTTKIWVLVFLSSPTAFLSHNCRCISFFPLTREVNCEKWLSGKWEWDICEKI